MTLERALSDLQVLYRLYTDEVYGEVAPKGITYDGDGPDHAAQDNRVGPLQLDGRTGNPVHREMAAAWSQAMAYVRVGVAAIEPAHREDGRMLRQAHDCLHRALGGHVDWATATLTHALADRIASAAHYFPRQGRTTLRICEGRGTITYDDDGEWVLTDMLCPDRTMVRPSVKMCGPCRRVTDHLLERISLKV